MPSNHVQFRLPKRIDEDLAARAGYFGSKTEAIRTDLYRYRRLIRDAQARMKRENIFSPGEQALILDALNGSLLGEHPEALAGSVEDSMALDGTAEKWSVNREILLQKLRGLTPIEFAALADAAERFWAAPDERDIEGGLL